MSEQPSERVMDRIAKMLRLANDAGASEGERDNALRMAHNTLAKYNLDIAEIEAREPKRKDDEPRVEKPVVFYGRPWARSVCRATAELFYCRYLYASVHGKKDAKHYFVGRLSNATTAALMAEYLVTSVYREARRAQRDASQGNEYFRAFGLGASVKIRYRVNQLIEESKPQQTGTGMSLMVIAQNELDANEAYIRQAHPSLRRGRTGAEIYSSDAFDKGHAYGSTISLSRQVE